MKLSVFIVTYNQEKFIEQTLESVCAQKTNFDFEIVIADDCSKDCTQIILKQYASKYPDKIKLILNAENLGAIKNYIENINLCQGEYIAHLDGDDLMLPGKLQKQVDFLDTHPECAICAHAVEIRESKGSKYIYQWDKDFGDVNDLLREDGFFAHSSKMFRKAAIPPEGFDGSPRIIADFLWHIQNVQYGLIGYLHDVLGVYHMHEGGIFSATQKPEYIETGFKDRLNALQYAFLNVKGASIEAFFFGFSKACFHVASRFYTLRQYDHFKLYIQFAEMYARHLGGDNYWLYRLRKYPALIPSVLNILHFRQKVIGKLKRLIKKGLFIA